MVGLLRALAVAGSCIGLVACAQPDENTSYDGTRIANRTIERVRVFSSSSLATGLTHRMYYVDCATKNALVVCAVYRPGLAKQVRALNSIISAIVSDGERVGGGILAQMPTLYVLLCLRLEAT